MYRNIVYGKLVVHSCIHKLEKECHVLNKEVGDCEIECEDSVVWRCPFFHLRIAEAKRRIKYVQNNKKATKKSSIEKIR